MPHFYLAVSISKRNYRHTNVRSPLFELPVVVQAPILLHNRYNNNRNAKVLQETAQIPEGGDRLLGSPLPFGGLRLTRSPSTARLGLLIPRDDPS